MPPKQPEKKKPFIRLNRVDLEAMHEGDGHLWAVSYADLLMVLMSFFVIFFSFSDVKETPNDANDVMMQISEGLKSAITGSTVAKENPAARAPSALVDSRVLESVGAEVLVNGKSIYVNLPDDIFAKGQFGISEETKTKLGTIYRSLSVNQQKIELVVIGHADSSKITIGSNPYLTNNFDLSSLRALRGVEFLIGQGFPEGHISAQGSSSGLRNSRTLSIRVRVKEETL